MTFLHSRFRPSSPFSAAAFALLLACGGPLPHGRAHAPPATEPGRSENGAEENDARLAAAVEQLITAALKEERCRGCVVLVGGRDRIHLRRAFGLRQAGKQPEEMTIDTLFDLASLTKPVVTSACCMRLLEEGKLNLDRPVAEYLPDFAAHGKGRIAPRHLLLHTSGLTPANPMSDYAEGPETAWTRLLATRPRTELGARFAYSDVNYLVLGRLIETLAGMPLDEYARREFFHPLALRDTGFNPAEALLPRIAPTAPLKEGWLRGRVHDPRAAALGGVAGHAGLFSTGDDLARFARMLLARGECEGKRVLKPETVDRWIEPHSLPGGGSRTLGWDHRSAYSSNRGEGMSARAVGHGGFTGTGLWIDPELDLFVVFLSSRLHPEGKGSVNPLIGAVGGAAADWARSQRRAPGRDPQ